jgi:predicted nucleic acid-binding protein
MLVDTSGFLCIFNEAEPFHQSARVFFDSALYRLTHNYILAEFVALAHARRLPRHLAVGFSEALLQSAEIEIVWVDVALHTKALEFIINRPDKNWSLCDAVSFILMEEHNLREALTTDHHFEQAGFVRLLI